MTARAPGPAQPGEEGGLARAGLQVHHAALPHAALAQFQALGPTKAPFVTGSAQLGPLEQAVKAGRVVSVCG